MTNQELSLQRHIIPIDCPECKKKVYVSYLVSVPVITAVLTDRIVSDTKAVLRNRINEMTMKDEDKQKYLDEVDKPECIVGPDDVEGIVRNIIATVAPEETAPEEAPEIVSEEATEKSEIITE